MDEWINASEQVPKNDNRVLACCGGDIFFARYVESIRKWRRDPNESGYDQWVTHWMPLPGLPKM